MRNYETCCKLNLENLKLSTTVLSIYLSRLLTGDSTQDFNERSTAPKPQSTRCQTKYIKAQSLNLRTQPSERVEANCKWRREIKLLSVPSLHTLHEHYLSTHSTHVAEVTIFRKHTVAVNTFIAQILLFLSCYYKYIQKY